MSSLNETLQEIYNIKLQIKDAIGTDSDVFADYPSLIEEAIGEGGGSGSQSELNTVLALSNTVEVEAVEDPETGVYTYYLDYNNPINQGTVAVSLKGEIDGKYIYTYVGFPTQMIIGNGTYTGQVQDTTYNTFAQMLGVPGNYVMNVEKISSTDWEVTTSCDEEYLITAFEGKLGSLATDPFEDASYDDETGEYVLNFFGLGDFGPGIQDGDPVDVTCTLQYTIGGPRMGLAVQNAYIGGTKTSLFKPANRAAGISISATYHEGADSLEIRIPETFVLGAISATTLENTPYIEYTATLYADAGDEEEPELVACPSCGTLIDHAPEPGNPCSSCGYPENEEDEEPVE